MSTEIKAIGLGNCYNPENVLKDDGICARIYDDDKGNRDAVIVDLGREVTVSEIVVKFYNYESNEDLTGFLEEFKTELALSIWHSKSLPTRGVDYDVENNGEEEIMWILTDDDESREYIVAKYYFEPMIDLSKYPLIAYRLKVSDGDVAAGIEYSEVSNGKESIKIRVDSYCSPTSWIERTFNAYEVAKSKGGYKYLKAIGLRLHEKSPIVKDNRKHYAYWDYLKLYNDESGENTGFLEEFNGYLPYQRAELYKEIIMKIVSKYSVGY
mgnify:CR=1 FL=1